MLLFNQVFIFIYVWLFKMFMRHGWLFQHSIPISWYRVEKKFKLSPFNYNYCFI